MKHVNPKSFMLKISFAITVLFFVFDWVVFAQVARSPSSGKPDIVKNAEKKMKELTHESGVYFKRGLLYLRDRHKSKARQEFDKAVEVFLLSGIKIRGNQKLRECYNQLIETIYRIEFFSNQKPFSVRRLSAVCGWVIEEGLAGEVFNNSVANRSGSLTKSAKDKSDNYLFAGFTEQRFEPSPRDELAKFDFTENEENIITRETTKEYMTLRKVAEKNKSLGFAFQMHPMIQKFLNYYRGRGRRIMEIGLHRSGMFMPMARRIFREEGIPENMAWIGQVESAWKPTARSWASAVGLWQFIPGTGMRYGLRRTSYLDERQSFEKATRASAKYLKFLADRYGGNWELAMAAYNCGEGKVDSAIRKAKRINFWKASPYLPRETQKYVPNILAVIIIANNPHKYGFGHVRPAKPLRYDRVRVPASTRLKLLAKASDTTVQYLRYLNPEFLTNVTPPEPYIVRVPVGRARNIVSTFSKMSKFGRNTARLKSSLKGETWANISRRTGVSVAELKRANPGMKLPRGRVIVPIKGNGLKNTSYSRPVRKTLPKNIKIAKAQSGDTVEKLVTRYNKNLPQSKHVSPAKVAKFNGLFVHSRLNVGRVIMIPTK